VRAQDIIHRLLEADEPEIDPEHYLRQAHVPWLTFSLITTRELRAFFQSMGYRVKNIYRHTAGGKRRFAELSVTVAPKDGRHVTDEEPNLLVDYMWEFVEQRLKRERRELGIIIHAYAFSPLTGEAYSKLNQIDITVTSLKSTHSPGGYRYDDFYPTNNRY
jgi:hypothetical protein